MLDFIKCLPITNRNYDVLKQPVITKVAGERSKKAQSRELLKSVAVSVSPKLKKIARYNKTNNRKIRERIGRTENPRKQRVSLTKSSAPKLKQHDNQNVKCKLDFIIFYNEDFIKLCGIIHSMDLSA